MMYKIATVKLNRDDVINYFKGKGRCEPDLNMNLRKEISDQSDEEFEMISKTTSYERNCKIKGREKTKAILDDEFMMGKNELDYTLVRRAIEQSNYQYNLRKSSSSVQDIEFIYDLVRCARRENTQSLLRNCSCCHGSSSSENNNTTPKCSKQSHSSDKKKLSDHDIKNIAKKIEENLVNSSEERDDRNEIKSVKRKRGNPKSVKKNNKRIKAEEKIMSYNIIVTVEKNVMTIQYCKKLKNGSVLVNIVEHVMDVVYCEEKAKKKSLQKKSSAKRKLEFNENVKPKKFEKKTKRFSSGQKGKKIYYNYIQEVLPNGKTKSTLQISETKFEKESKVPKENKTNTENERQITTTKIAPIPIQNSLQLPEIGEILDDFDLCNFLVQKGEGDLGLIDRPANLEPIKENKVIDFYMDENGFIETVNFNMNDQINLEPQNVGDINFNCNENVYFEKFKKVIVDLNSSDFARKCEAYEILNKLINYK